MTSGCRPFCRWGTWRSVTFDRWALQTERKPILGAVAKMASSQYSRVEGGGVEAGRGPCRIFFCLPTTVHINASERNVWSNSPSISEALYHSSSMIAPSNPLSSCCTLWLFCSTTSFHVSFDSLIHPSLFDPSFPTHLASIHFSLGGEFVPNAFCFALFALCTGTIIYHRRSRFRNAHQKSSITLSSLSQLTQKGQGIRKPDRKLLSLLGNSLHVRRPIFSCRSHEQLRGEGASKIF